MNTIDRQEPAVSDAAISETSLEETKTPLLDATSIDSFIWVAETETPNLTQLRPSNPLVVGERLQPTLQRKILTMILPFIVLPVLMTGLFAAKEVFYHTHQPEQSDHQQSDEHW
ncbi:MAG: hypothetical protein LH474_05955 [Chamaesiphon sp.]|nr:hypothetical protein [Chamaesiphon sp.]